MTQWESEDGTLHSSEQAARDHNKYGNWMNNLLFAIIFIVPVLMAKLAGFIFALLFKLGKVGKILQTIIVAIVCPIIFMMIMFVLSENKDIKSAVEAIATFLLPASAVVPALWYWLWHYDEIKEVDASTFSNNIKVSFIIAFFGLIVAVIVGMIGNPGFGTFLAIAVTAAAFFFYFRSVKSYAQEAAKTRQPDPRRKMIIIIGLAIAIGLSVLVFLLNTIGDAIDSVQRRNTSVTQPVQLAIQEAQSEVVEQ